MTKGQKKAFYRRRIRRAEKNVVDVSRDKMIGGVCRRGYGAGVVTQ